MRVWSKYQENIFEFVANGEGNAIVQAVAGSGKTTTIVEALKRIKGSSIFLAFNKAIANELAERGVNAKTFHGLCYSPVTKHKGTRTIESNKLRKLVDANLSGENSFIYGAFICKLVGLARQSGIGCLLEDTEQEWHNLIEHHDLELNSDKGTIVEAVEYARKLLQWSNESSMVDFDDLLYLAVKDGLVLPKFNYVFVDEAQDTNAIQRAILRKIISPFSRIIAVGDKAQAIYGFRGADSNSLQLIAEEFNAIELPLTVSYRCSQKVVEYAQGYVSHIEAAPEAIVGAIEDKGEKWTVKDFASSDMVVCRTTKPLIVLAYKMLKARIPVRIMGREIGQGLIDLIKKMNAKGIDQLIEKLSIWKTREVEKAVAKKNESKAQSIEDKADAILCLIDGMEETNRTVPALMGIVNTLFSDSNGCTTLATIHKAKGLESRRVFWLNSSKCPSLWAKQDWQKLQETNLCYVAVTRAKETLVLIEEPKEKEQF